MYIIKSLCWICLQRYLILYCFFYKLQYFQTLSVNIFFFIFHLIAFGALIIVLHQENVHSQHFAAYYYSPGIPFHPHVPRREHGVQESTSTSPSPKFPQTHLHPKMGLVITWNFFHLWKTSRYFLYKFIWSGMKT